MSGLPAQIIQLGFDNVAAKYYAACVNALYFYDYFLTLPDEVEYAWRGKKTWLFYLFILNRYGAMFYVGWMSAVLTSMYPDSACKRTSILQPVYFLCATTIAQIFLIARIYALTRRGRIVAGFFVILSTTQTMFGVGGLAHGSKTAAEPIPIELDAYHSCTFTTNFKMELAYTSLSLAFDSLAFITVVVSAYRSIPSPSVKQLLFSGIVGMVVQDAIIYFALIFASHLTLAMFMYFARKNPLALLPAPGCFLFLPMMVSRLFLSLKKSGDPRRVAEWHRDHFSHVEVADPFMFARRVREPAGKGKEREAQS